MPGVKPREVDRLRRALVDLSPLWPEVASMIASDQAKTFDTAGSNVGRAWPTLASRTARRGGRRGTSPLVFTGELRALMTSPTEGVRGADKFRLDFGPPQRYQWVHHHGSTMKGIPARRFIELSGAARKAIYGRIEEHLVARAREAIDALGGVDVVGGRI